MGFNIVLVTLVLCIVTVVVASDNCNRNGKLPEYTRIKRAKYYSNPPSKFYRRPPITHPVKGIYSHTPPPSYMMDEEQYPGLRPSKVSKRPTNDGLGDEDLNNIMKYLSKKDLDKIIEFAGEKERIGDKFREYDSDFHEYGSSKKPDNIYKTFQDIDEIQKFASNFNNNDEEKSYKIVFNTPDNYNTNIQDIVNNERFSYNSNTDNKQDNNINYVRDATEPRILYSRPQETNIPNYNSIYTNTQLTADKSENYQISYPNYNSNEITDNLSTNPDRLSDKLNKHQISFPNQYKPEEIAEMLTKDGNIFTDSSVMPEESLPRPVNLREEYEASFTNNIPVVVKSEPDSYQPENFGDLPLMNYHNSKLHSVSSYHVPHYTVTSPKQVPSPAQPPSPPKSSPDDTPPLELAPQSDGSDQSDAHLKAIRIWTHRSRGTAYTLHSDGSLSLEGPAKPKSTSYGHPY